MIPYGRHNIDQYDIDAVIEVLKSDWLTCGPVVDLFEQKLARMVNSKHVISCSNGTTALHLALLSLGISEKDFVLVPAITFLASANAVRYVGANVIFVDVDPKTGLMTVETLEKAILDNKEKNLKAVINVHLGGQCEDLEKIQKVSRQYGLKIIEDAAHAIGTRYINHDKKFISIGSNIYSDITTFSFHPVKTIAMGEGGAVTTNSEQLATKIRELRSHGMLKNHSDWLNNNEEKGPWYYEMHELGYNYRISDINCALGLSQLNKLESFKDQRNKIVQKYDELFEGIEFISPVSKLSSCDPAWHLYVLLFDFKSLRFTRKQIMEHLKEKGIGTQVHYIPLYKQPYYKKLYGEIKLEGAEDYYSKCLSLPIYFGLTDDKILEIADIVKSYAR